MLHNIILAYDVTAKQFDSVRSWLRSLRLTEYVDTFQIHGFTMLERLHNLWDVELTSVCSLCFVQFASFSDHFCCCWCFYHSAGWPQTWKTWSTQGFLWTWKTQWILREFCATSGINYNKQSIFISSFKYLCKTAVDWVNRVVRISQSSDPA